MADDDIKLKDILDLSVFELVFALYSELVSNDATDEDTATLNFGNKKWRASLEVKLVNGDVDD